MALHLYDTYTRKLRELHGIEPGRIGLYACGPTVYDHAHIGNLRTYLFVDFLRRTLEYSGFQVKHVMNITDVGHLTSDQDTGDDKMEKGSLRTGRSAWEIAQEYTRAFKEDLALLNIQAPGTWCHATDHIAEQIEFIADLERKGYTYRTADGIYFDTSRQADYGYLARLDRAGLQSGKRVDIGEKKHLTDFALWKFSGTPGVRQMEWSSPWGVGFPGWHIECSAMSARHLGEYFDIHCGGEDHVPVHHSNEIAQSEARYGTRAANFWLHGAFLKSDGDKMSKSGMFVHLQTLLDRGIDPLAYRYLCLTTHYRSQLNFTDDALSSAANGLDRMRMLVVRLGAPGVADDDYLARFGAEISKDLNMPRALALAWELLKSELPDGVKKATILRFDETFGLRLVLWQPAVVSIPPALLELMAQRELARNERRWSDADRLRLQAREIGYELDDTAQGQQARKM
ncbi:MULTISPECIES: cysteine--tRNA ligase [unclassified Janthinobacterium]|uniref:cysteine--tRNA ligase n=1 Tax=unclassified Janthinobacterium TaxID=2610881 RepID=UPI00034863BF|nr:MULTISPECIES: cysteine--tRNA ligase [unclassified Janthinobacterium]MEC5162773.1 cysteinyl-tRNA synthetase [Janthinobacterium sp. CG_S6]